MKPDILSKSDIKLLVDTFYDKAKINPVIGFIFTDVAKVNWEHHLPKMYAFWESVLIGGPPYGGNPMVPHLQLSKLTPLTEKEFSAWLSIFNETMNELFEGPVAEEGKARAANIAALMLCKIQSVK